MNIIEDISEEQLLAFVQQISESWLSPDDAQRLEAFVPQLKQQQSKLSDLVRRHLAELLLN